VPGRVYIGGNLLGLGAEDKAALSRASDGHDDDSTAAVSTDRSTDESTDQMVAKLQVNGVSLPSEWCVQLVSCGYRHTALVTTSGLLLTCGHGETGRLGHGDEEDRVRPHVVMHLAHKLGLGVVTVGCGREHTVAVVDDGQVFSWGWGECGRLGLGEVGKVLVPTRVPEFVGLKGEGGGGGLDGSDGAVTPAPRAKLVACGREHTLIVSEGGLVFACGPGTLGRLGLGPGIEDVLYPTLVSVEGSGLEHEVVVSVSGGEMHSAVTCASGALFTWGFGESGALGHGDLDAQELPKRVQNFLPHESSLDDDVEVVPQMSAVACGAYHTISVTNDGQIYTWGDGESGALGFPDRGDEGVHRCSIPRPLQLGVAAARVAAGHLTSAAIDVNGAMHVWGCAEAEDGVTPTATDLVPCEVAPGSTDSGAGAARTSTSVMFASCDMGGYHSVASTVVLDRAGAPLPPASISNSTPTFGSSMYTSGFSAALAASRLPPSLRRAALARARDDEEILAMIADYRPDKGLVGGGTAKRTRARSKTPVRGAAGGGGGKKPAPRMGSLRVAANVGQSQTLFVTDPLQQGVRRK